MSSRAFDGVFKDVNVHAIRWHEGTMHSNERGSFNHLVDLDLGIKPGMIVKTMDTRRCQLLLIGTPIGNIVLFKRFRDNREVIYAELPRELRMLMGALVYGEQTEDMLTEMLGYGGRDNIGVRIVKFLKYANSKVKQSAA